MNLFAVAGLLLGITSLLLAFVVAIYGKTKLHRIWAFFNVSVAIWGLGCFVVGKSSDESIAIFGWKFAHVGGIFVAVFFYHMVCTFCDLKRKRSIIAAYSLGLFFLFLNVATTELINKTRFVYNSLYYNDATLPFSILVSLWLLAVSWSFVDLLKYFPKTKGIKRTQTLYIILSFLTGFVGGISTFLPEFGIDKLYPFGNFTIPVYCIISTYAILRYRLMDINLVFRKSMVYSLSAGILTGLFVVIVTVMTKYLSDIAGVTSYAIMIVSALSIAVLFNPLKNIIQSFIDKSFYKKSIDYYPTIRNISRKLTSIFDLDELFSYVGDALCSTLGLATAYLLYPTPGRGYEVVYHKVTNKNKKQKENSDESVDEKTIKKNSEIVQYFKKSDEILIRDELPGFESELGQEIIERMNSELRPFNGEAVAPVYVDKKLVLLLILGEKESGDMFTHEDINLLNIVSNQISIAIKNSQLYKDKVHTERLASIGMMSATFAHEIRNPLTSLKTFAQLMPEKYDDEEFRDTFSKIVVKEIERINSLINDLLDFSAEKESGRINEFELTSFIDDIVEYTKDRLDIDNQNILIQKVYNSASIDMYGDVEKLKQAFMNIFNNGCQAMNGEGVLTVNIKPNAKNVEISIKDTGEGIHPDDIPKIFDPFVTTKEMGVGLGLAISKRVIEDHNGKIGVNSKLSSGTKFTVSLPMPKA
jgi:signal transduction histidine kinase